MAMIEERQITQARVVTQILTRASTTITTIVTLGNDPAITNPVVPTPEITTPPPPAPPVAPTSSSPALTNEQLGAILGSVLGFVFIILPLCYCCVCRRPRHWRPDYSDDYSSSDSESERIMRMRARGGPFGMPQMRQPFEPVLVPPPPRIPPKRYAPYRQTPEPQISGVRIYP